MEPYRHWFDRALLEEMVADGASPVSRLVVSVDYDFFVPHPDLDTISEEQAEMLQPGMEWWLDEWYSSERAGALWQELHDRLVVVGGDPEALAAPDPNCAPGDFADALSGRVRFTEVLVSDSHTWGGYVLLRAAHGSGGPVELVSFDAHHDCGYRNSDSLARSRHRARERPGCDDWVQFGLVHGHLARATVVYPDWRRGKHREAQQPTLPPRYRDRFTSTEWSSWLATADDNEPTAATLLLVRSSAYVPPWLDHDARFLELAARLAPNGWRCLDCDPPLGIRIGDQDACRPRTFVPRRPGGSPAAGRRP